MEESKNTRIAFALLCGLAVCCSVMYITSDGAEIMTEDAPHSTGSGQDTRDPASVDSTDVMKTGLLYTKTPDTIAKGPEGRQRLLTFLDKVEANIAKEVQERKADIAAIRAQMAKNMEFNQEARKKMKKMLLAKMAVNAKKAKDDLNTMMREVQKKFAEAAATENARNAATMARSKKTREIMAKNKAEGAKDLKMAVLAQQRALTTLSQATNKRIASTNKHIAQNAAHIKENAKKARQDLDNAMDAFDNKMANVKEEASKGRSKLAAQAEAQDKKFREWANNKIKEMTEKTAAEFQKVRTKMAADREHADAQLAATTSRLTGSLQAAQTLQNKRFAQTVSDIAEAKKEANDRVEGFRTSFKADILHLSGVVEQQSTRLNARVTQLAGVVTKNRLEQAHVNSQVNAELKRIQKIGDDRYQEHLDKDAELKDLMAKNKAATTEAMQEMSEAFFAEVTKIKDQMKKDRNHAENALASSTASLFETIEKNGAAQDAVNKELTEATRRAALDAAAALKEAKDGFAEKVGSLHSTVTELAKKHNSKLEELTGVVQENAIKDANGREELKKISEFNKNLLKTAVSDAVHKGEQRALQIESKMKDINEKTRAQMNNRITTEISHLQKNIHAQVTELTLQTKEARAAMKKEIMFAIKSAETVAKKNLDDTVAWAEGQFSTLHANLAQHEEESAEARAGLKATIVADKESILEKLSNAVAAQERALLAYRQEMCEQAGVNSGVINDHGEHVVTDEQKKNCGGGDLNKKLGGHYEVMQKNAEFVAAQMKENAATLEGSLEAAKDEADAQLAAADAASKQRYDDTIDAVKAGIADAAEKSEKRFAGAYTQMAKDAQEVSDNLAGATENLNKKIAKAAALEDERFSKTVKLIGEAKAEAAAEVGAAKKAMLADMVAVNSKLKLVESRLDGEIQVVSASIISETASQKRVNDEVDANLKALVKKNDDMHTANKEARGVIREVMEKNKALAAEEVANLAKEAATSILQTQDKMANYLSQFKEDLEESTKKVYHQLAEDDKTQKAANEALHGELDTETKVVASKLEAAEKLFASRITTMTNAVVANAKYYEDTIAEKTGIVMDWKKAAEEDRADIRKVRGAMVDDLHRDIAAAIQKAEAEIKAVEETAMLNIATEKKALLTTISESVENMADNVFATVQGNRAKIADNYLSLKAYAAAAADLLTDYLAKGKGRNLSSVGDLLNSLAQISDVETVPAAGEGFGSASIPTIFSGESVEVDNSITKINGLVNEYVTQVGQVKNRWPMGLGKYLIAKLEVAMQGPGALEVDKLEERPGNFVFMNAHSVGLSSKLPDFQSLAVKMTVYEGTLSKMTGNLPHDKKAAQKDLVAKPPEWQGN